MADSANTTIKLREFGCEVHVPRRLSDDEMDELYAEVEMRVKDLMDTIERSLRDNVHPEIDVVWWD